MTLGQISVAAFCVVIWAVLIGYIARDVREAIRRRRRVTLAARPRLGIDRVRHIYLVTDDEEEHPK